MPSASDITMYNRLKAILNGTIGVSSLKLRAPHANGGGYSAFKPKTSLPLNFLTSSKFLSIETTVATVAASIVYYLQSLIKRVITKPSPVTKVWYNIASSSDGTLLTAAAQNGYLYTSFDSGVKWTESTDSGIRNWTSVLSSANGEIRVASALTSSVFVSIDYGTVWLEKSIPNITAGVEYLAMSSDGNKIIAGVEADYLYLSTDFGDNWTQLVNAGQKSWRRITVSSDCSKIVAQSKNNLFVSVNSGNTWTTLSYPNVVSNFESISMSSTGTTLVGGTYEGSIWISSDLGNSWIEQVDAGNGIWKGISISSDGTKIVAINYATGSIWTIILNGGAWSANEEFTGNKNWQCVTCSADFSTIVAGVFDEYLYTSFDSGGTWTQRRVDDPRNWKNVASSSDGTKLVAAVGNGYLYTSADSGATWIERTSSESRNWNSVASSSDGTKLVAAVGNGYIYTSADSGATWTQRTSSGSRNWNSVASSSDGTKLVASQTNGSVYTSADSGATWTQRTSAGSRFWNSVASSSDGTNLVAAVGNGYLYTSADSGATWTQRTSAGSKYWRNVASSSDGTKLVATVGSSSVYTSADSGATWTQRTSSGSRFWTSVASSSDGTRLVAATGNSYLYASADSGATWTQLTSSGSKNWNSVALSSDGSRLVASEADGYIYIT